MKRIHIQEKSKGLKRLTYSSLVAGVATIVAVAAMTTPALAAKYNIKASRIAHGIPLGGELEYVDGGTLSHAFFGRRDME